MPIRQAISSHLIIDFPQGYLIKPVYILSWVMPVKTQIPDDHGIFFITFTCFRWISLIDITNSYDLIFKWFDYLKDNAHYVTGYVIMPNHVHALIGFPDIENY
jgi:hypothetical protein